MLHQIAQQLLGRLKVIPQLGTAGVMGKGKDPVPCLNSLASGLLRHAAHRPVYTGDRGNDPQFVACPHPAVWTAVAQEGVRSIPRLRLPRRRRGILIVQQSLQIGLEIVAVQPRSRWHSLGGMADLGPILDHHGPVRQIGQSHLVAKGDLLLDPHSLSIHRHGLSLGQRPQSHRHIVLGMDPNRVSLHRTHHSATEPSLCRQTGFFQLCGV